MIALPTLVVARSFEQVAWTITIGYIGLISLLTAGFNWYDKRQAKRNQQRVPENVLHALELIGGWPAAYIAQQWLRHKTSKRSYRITYWAIVALYQYLALEQLLNWKIARSVRALVGG
ncbi:MAG: DUF1294 domain-containing protein [Opitutaceae bacterium]